VYKDATARQEKAFWYKNDPEYWGQPTIYGSEDGPPAWTKLLHSRVPRGAKLVEKIKHERWERRQTQPKQNSYPSFERELGAAIQQMRQDLNENCIDNIRVAALDVRKDMRSYRKQAASGCCGRHDEEVVIRGRKFTIGCNFGH
jgi:hypothetical protein